MTGDKIVWLEHLDCSEMYIEFNEGGNFNGSQCRIKTEYECGAAKQGVPVEQTEKLLVESPSLLADVYCFVG